MGKIGFDIKNEFIPSFDKFQSNINKRMMFLKLFNQEVSCELKFTKDEIKASKKESLFNVFTNKIIKNLQYDCYIKTPLKKIDIEKTNKINRFFKKLENKTKFKYSKVSLINSYEESNIDKALALIDILQKYNFSFYLDGEKIFKNFVSNKILKSSENREVKIHTDSIDIKCEEHFFNTKIYTFWEFLDAKDLKIDTHIQKAVDCIETTEFKQVYLVYPKNENFDKHIKIKSEQITCKEYDIKLIPYSLRSTLR